MGSLERARQSDFSHLVDSRLDERAPDVLAIRLAPLLAVALAVLAPRRAIGLAFGLGNVMLDGSAHFY